MTRRLHVSLTCVPLLVSYRVSRLRVGERETARGFSGWTENAWPDGSGVRSKLNTSNPGRRAAHKSTHSFSLFLSLSPPRHPSLILALSLALSHTRTHTLSLNVLLSPTHMDAHASPLCRVVNYGIDLNAK